MNFEKKVFTIAVKVDKPIVVGIDSKIGRRQLIPITEGTLNGDNISGIVLPGGIDSQVIRPDGICEVSARYAVKLDDGSSIYIENDGIRTVPDEYVSNVLNGEFIDPNLYYFCTKPVFELFGESVQWMKKKVFICKAKRYPDVVELDYYVIE